MMNQSTKMEPQNYHTWVLITRALSNEADASEKEELREWFNEDYSHQFFFEELKASWNEEPHKDGAYVAFLFDKKRGLSKLRDKIHEEGKTCDSANMRSLRRSRGLFAWKWAASILLLVAAVSVWAGIHLWQPAVTSSVTNGMEQKIITLPDGSKVRLNNNSKISFTKGFAGSTRRVNLKGEAFFHVKHDADKRFRIYTGNAIIEDIGTSFNVKEEKGGKIVVAVKDGAALFKNASEGQRSEKILKKGQVGILDSQGHINSIEKTNVQNYLSWMNGRLSFKKMSFEKIANQLENIYGIDCQLADSSLSRLKLTAYTRKTSLNEVLNMIALSLNIMYQKKKNKVVWMKKETNNIQAKND